MKIFLSWSGDRSQAVATLLKNWLRLVIQSLDPWLSSQNIENGSVWYNEITTQLQEITTGILCLTQENKDKPWILFEAGALAKGLSTSRVCTLLIDFEPKDVQPPLSQFNHTKVTRDGLKKLITDLNSRLGDKALEDSILTDTFDAHWPKFEQQYQTILQNHKPEAKPKSRSTDDLVSEILENTREILSMAKQTSGVEQKTILARAERIRTAQLSHQLVAIDNLLEELRSRLAKLEERSHMEDRPEAKKALQNEIAATESERDILIWNLARAKQEDERLSRL